MKAAKWLAIVLAAYVGIVAAFESLIGWLQPANESTLVLTTFDERRTAHDRVLSRLETDGRLYVAVNHWPRAWYRRALVHPQVQVAIDGNVGDYTAVPVTGEEHDRVQQAHPSPLGFRFLTGFPPRHFVRLDPR